MSDSAQDDGAEGWVVHAARHGVLLAGTDGGRLCHELQCYGGVHPTGRDYVCMYVLYSATGDVVELQHGVWSFFGDGSEGSETEIMHGSG